MKEITDEFISALLQVLVFTLIPFIFFLFRKDKAVSFFHYIGFVKPTGKSLILVLAVSFLFVCTGLGLIFIDDGFKQVVLLPPTVTGKLRLMGLNNTSLTLLIIIALIKTALSEEIFFRGFIAKRMMHKFGFRAGNLIQALIFGLIHLLLFSLLTQITFITLSIILVFSSFAGWSIGYIKEKYGNGSVVPGWMAHGLGNMVSYYIIAFVI